MSKVVNTHLRDKQFRALGMTEKQVVVANFLLAGATTEQISHAMHLSIKGVKYHITTIFRKVRRGRIGAYYRTDFVAEFGDAALGFTDGEAEHETGTLLHMPTSRTAQEGKNS